jgi:hypothetical protein
VRLGGFLSAPGHPKLPAELCLVPGGALIVGAVDRFAGVIVDASSGASVRYEPGTLRDRLLVDGVALTVPTAKAGEARRCLALGKLRKQGRSARSLTAAEDRYVSRLSEAARALAGSLVGAGDVAIAVREIGEAREVTSELGPNVEQRRYLVLTAERAQVFALSELGDATVDDVDAKRLRIETRGGKAVLVTDQGDHPLETRQVSAVTEIVELALLEPSPRLFEAARRLYLLPEGDGRARARRLVEAAAGREQPLARLVSLLLAFSENAHERVAETTTARAAESAQGATESSVAELPARWNFALAPCLRCVRELRALGTRGEPVALHLHRALAGQLAEDAEGEADLAEHELSAGDVDRARRLAESRLSKLPPDEDAVLNPKDASQAHVLRLKLHELIARGASSRGRGATPSISALARLEPMSKPRLQALASATADTDLDARLAQRAQEVLECLAPGGLTLPTPPGDRDPPPPLPRNVLDERVSHPLSRGSGRLAARLSELVAAVPEPALGFLRDFCEELNEARHSDAVRALDRATSLFALPRVRAYVSHGARSLGLRAFGSDEPFVLVGANHLDDTSPHALAGTELDFAFGSELAHLAFGHQRVTVSEVWIGAAGKTRDALLALGLALPVIAEISGGRALKLLKRLSPETVVRGLEAADLLEKLVGGRKNSLSRALGQHNEELIGAHRLVQLSADRAGLVLAPHLPSALRAILLMRADYRDLFALAREVGLATALERRPLAEPAMADLIVRIRSLAAFYLSPDFDAVLGLSAFQSPPSRPFSLFP